MKFSPIFKKDFIVIRLEWYYTKLQKEFFSKDETEEKHTPNNLKNLRNTFQFSQLCSTIDTKFQST